MPATIPVAVSAVAAATRINDLMWSELFVANKPALLKQMNLFADKFNELKTMLETEDVDGMRSMMRHSTERRALFDKK